MTENYEFSLKNLFLFLICFFVFIGDERVISVNETSLAKSKSGMKKNSSSRGLRITFHAYFIYGVSGSA
jgi:hypothetical protein